MEKVDILRDIAERTDGDIYLGVVGAVRTGKSTFIKKFMEQVVIPNISNEADRTRAQDELPHSGAGKTVTTIEPKFVPNQAVSVHVAEGLDVNVRLVDCVGYAIEGAQGFEDENGARMINTPWFDDPIPFQEAAEVGTRKVIQEHSTVGILVTTDGSVADIPRSSYEEAESRIVSELKETGKPFVVILNTTKPLSEAAKTLASELSEKYEVPVMPLNASLMNEDEILNILQEVLYEFPVNEVDVNLPSWVMVLKEEHWLRSQFEHSVHDTVKDIKRLRDINGVVDKFYNYDFIQKAALSNVHMGQGVAEIDLFASDELYDQVLTEIVGVEIKGKDHLLELMQDFCIAKKEYDKISDALQMVNATGYGVTTPCVDDMSVEEPELIKQGTKFGVRIKANASSIHMIKVNVESEFAPIIGSEKQGEELVNYLMKDFESNPVQILQTDIFGRSLNQIIQDGIQSKTSMMPDNARYKLQETLERIVNEGSGGLIAIIL